MSEVPCSVCGRPLVIGARFCSECGARFESPADAASAAPTESVPSVEVPTVPRTPALANKATMIGVSAADLYPAHMFEAAATAPPASTTEPAPSTVPDGAPLDPGAPEIASASARALPSALKTMVGVALPGIAPTAASSPVATSPSPEAPLAGRSAASGTMLGVALPGIAPTAATPGAGHGIAPPPEPPKTSAPLFRTAVMQAPVIPAPKPLEPEGEAPRAPVRVAPKGVPLALVATLVGGLLVVGGGLIAFLWRGAPAISAKPTLDARGAEELTVTCDTCADGDEASLGTTRAKFAGHRAGLPLAAPLKVGENALDVGIHRGSKEYVVRVVVPLAYRVRADVSGVTAEAPTIVVRVEAAPGAKASLDGQPVELDAAGIGTRSFDVTSDVTGQDAEVRTVERSAKYEITMPGRPAESGTVSAKVPVTPMVVFRPLPRQRLVTSTSVDLSGSAAKGATVTVAGNDVPVDANGRFRAALDMAEGGDAVVVVRATAPNHATRIATWKLRRVNSPQGLASALKEFASTSKVNVDAFASAPASVVGQSIVLRGTVAEGRGLGERSVAILRDVVGCTKKPCLVRVVSGSADPPKPGSHVTVYGSVSGAFTSPTGDVPEVEADVVR